MLFQVLCGFEPIFYTTHPNEEPIKVIKKMKQTGSWSSCSIRGFIRYRYLSDEEQSAMITEHKKRISNVYNKIQKEREAFMKTVG